MRGLSCEHIASLSYRKTSRRLENLYRWFDSLPFYLPLFCVFFFCSMHFSIAKFNSNYFSRKRRNRADHSLDSRVNAKYLRWKNLHGSSSSLLGLLNLLFLTGSDLFASFNKSPPTRTVFAWLVRWHVARMFQRWCCLPVQNNTFTINFGVSIDSTNSD